MTLYNKFLTGKCVVCIIHLRLFNEKENANHYGSYSGLIEKAVSEFLSRPVEPYEDDIHDIEEVKKSDEWIEIETLRNKIRNQ